MYEFIDILRASLLQDGFDIAENHLRQAVENIEVGNYEAASGQLRSFVEGFFDRVHWLLIGGGLKQGPARKDLVEKGKITKENGELLKAVVSVLHGEGSHAGRLTSSAAASRLFICAGIAHAALDLIPNLPTVASVFEAAGLKPINECFRSITDKDITTSCPACNQHQNLEEATFRRGEELAEYVCVNGCQVILVIGRPGRNGLWEGRGKKIGNFVIRNAREILIPNILKDKFLSVTNEKFPSLEISALPASLIRRLGDKNDTI